MKFKVPSAMKRKRSKEQQELFLNACETNREGRHFLQKDTTLSDEEFFVIIHNICFYAV
jgi:hypothetical protein